MSDKPTADPDAIRELKEYLQDDLNRFVYELTFRARTLLEASELPRALIAMEMLESVFSAFEGGRTHPEISEAYPVEAWRTDTVEVPRAWMRELVTGWTKYKDSPTGATLGEAFGFEGHGQGVSPARKKLVSLNRNIHLSNAVLKEYLFERGNGGSGSWERACGVIADAEGLSLDTVKRASKANRKRTLKSLNYVGVLGGKTSQGRAPESS